MDKTTNSLSVEKDSSRICIPEYFPKKMRQKYCTEWIQSNKGEGDGVVNLDSLLIPKKWEVLPEFHPMPGTEHSSLLKNG